MFKEENGVGLCIQVVGTRYQEDLYVRVRTLEIQEVSDERYLSSMLQCTHMH